MKKFKYLVDCECIRLSIIMASYLQSFGKREELKFNINSSFKYRFPIRATLQRFKIK